MQNIMSCLCLNAIILHKIKCRWHKRRTQSLSARGGVRIEYVLTSCCMIFKHLYLQNSSSYGDAVNNLVGRIIYKRRRRRRCCLLRQNPLIDVLLVQLCIFCTKIANCKYISLHVHREKHGPRRTMYGRIYAAINLCYCLFVCPAAGHRNAALFCPFVCMCIYK